MNKNYLLLVFAFFMLKHSYAQPFCCSALDDVFALYCLSPLSSCTGDMAPCDDATFDALFGSKTYSFFSCGGTLGCDSPSSCNGGISDGSSLPVELTAFDLIQISQKIQINWETASEITNRGFLIQHAIDGKNWNDLAFIEGNGNSVKVNRYTYKFEAPSLGANYFRLKQIDFDESYEFSPIRVAIFRGDLDDMKLVIVPNPSTDYIVPVFPPVDIKEKETIHFEIYSDQGKLVKSFPNMMRSNIKLDVHDLPSGTYSLTSKIKNRVHSARFVKM